MTFNRVLDCAQAIADTSLRVKLYGYRTHTYDGVPPLSDGKKSWRGPYVFEVYAEVEGLKSSKFQELTAAVNPFGLDFTVGAVDQDGESSSGIHFKPRLSVPHGKSIVPEERGQRSSTSSCLDRPTTLLLLDQLANESIDCVIEVWRTSMSGFPRYLFDCKIGHLMRSHEIRRVLDILAGLGLEGWGDEIHAQDERPRSRQGRVAPVIVREGSPVPE